MYEWDVCFQLPQGPLPGAFYYSAGNGSARISYTLSGYVGRYGASLSWGLLMIQKKTQNISIG